MFYGRVRQYHHPIFVKHTRLNYTWINQDRKSVQLAAPTYIDYVMTWIQNLLDDEGTFPTKSGEFNIRPITKTEINTP
jgi:MOB kinase activator 1